MTIVQNFMSNNPTIEGTASELVSVGLVLNGQKVDAVGVSVLAKYGIIETVGKAPKIEGKRGKVGNVYRVKKIAGVVDFVV